MSSRGGRRTGSGRKKIHASLSEGVKFWQRGHRRIWLDCQIYSLWVSAKIYCGYRSNSAFAAHLLSLERRRGKHLSFIFHKCLVPLLVPFLWLFPCSNSFSSLIREINTAEAISRREKKRDDGPSAKRWRHVEGHTAVPLVISTPMNGKDIQVQLPDLSLGDRYHNRLVCHLCCCKGACYLEIYWICTIQLYVV